MRRFPLLIIAVFFIDCHQSAKINGRNLSDTLEILKKKADFKPLNPTEAYNFINKYYLPRLDTTRTKRKILMYALKNIDFNERYKMHKGAMESEYAGNKNTWIPPANLSPQSFLDKKFIWNAKMLLNTEVIEDSLLLIRNPKLVMPLKKWRKKYGYGYMVISYPQYNPNTKILVFREWIENYDECGTGREREFWFTRIPGGWKVCDDITSLRL
jgi:hypothetical protein